MPADDLGHHGLGQAGRALQAENEDNNSDDSPAIRSVPLSPLKTARVLAFVAVLLTLLSLLVGLVWFAGGPWVRGLNVDNDLSLPSWYSALTLLFASGILAMIAYVRGSETSSYVRHWVLLSAIFLFIATDEMIRIHERVAGVLVRPALESLSVAAQGLLYYPWVLAYGPLLLVFIVAYFKFWLDLPAKVRLLFGLAGALYVGGAMGVELGAAWFDSANSDLGVFLTVHVEELMEMFGAVVFIYALLYYLRVHLMVREISLR